VWRDPAVQKEKKTNRHVAGHPGRGPARVRAREGDDREVDRRASRQLRARCSPAASLAHDENNYRSEMQKGPRASRPGARTGLRRIPGGGGPVREGRSADLPQEKETTNVYELWFYAALGACDLKAIDEDKLPRAAQEPEGEGRRSPALPAGPRGAAPRACS
jgi:hypothetical protein